MNLSSSELLSSLLVSSLWVCSALLIFKKELGWDSPPRPLVWPKSQFYKIRTYPSAKTASLPPLRPSTQFSTSPKFLPKQNTSALPSLFTKITTWSLKIPRQKSSKKPLVVKPRTQAARTTLIQYVAAAIPTFTMSTFLLPKTLCKEIDTLSKNFWWGFQKKKKNCSPKVPSCQSRIKNPNWWRSLGQSPKKQIPQELQPSWCPLSPSSFLALEKHPKNFKSCFKKRSLFHYLQRSKPPHILTTPWIPTLQSFKPTPNPKISQAFLPITFLISLMQTVDHGQVASLIYCSIKILSTTSSNSPSFQSMPRHIDLNPVLYW